MEDSLRGIVDVHGQRLYYNVSNIHSVMRMAPFGDLFAQWFNDFVGVSNETQVRKRDMTWARGRRSKLTEAAELMAIVGHVTTQYATLPKQVRAFEQRVTRFAKTSTPSALADASAEGLIERVAGFLKIRNQQWIGAGLSDGACMVCCGALEWFLRRHFDDDPNVLLHGLLRGLPDIVSSEPPRHLWRLSRRIQADDSLRALFEEDTPSILKALGWDGTRMNLEHPLGRPLQTFLDDWGFRCTGELMLTVSSFQEDPAPVVDMLRAYLSMNSGGPDSVIKAQGKLREAQSAELESKLDPLRALAFSKLQRATAASLALRERSRLKQALLYRCLRRIALALGARWHEAGLLLKPEDVFFLHWQELLEVAPKGPLPTKTILERKERFARESAWREAPDSFTLPRGEQWDPLMHTELEKGTQTQDPIGDGSVLTGIAAAGGHVTARAAVALSKDDFHRIKAGDILVAPQTDPGWATVLFLVRGLVMERGGMLSHGAIIAREFGIPSVIAIPNATSRIPHASTLRVDGDQGHVHILE
jgi:pyruvate,water dikinase